MYNRCTKHKGRIKVYSRYKSYISIKFGDLQDIDLKKKEKEWSKLVQQLERFPDF